MRRVRCPQSRDSSTARNSASEPLTQPGTRSIQLCGSSQARVSRRKPGSKEGSAVSKAKKACTCSNVTAWKRKGDTIKMVSPGKGGTIKMVSSGKGGTIKMVSPQGDGTSFNDDVGGAT